MFREWRVKEFFEEFEKEIERINQLIERMMDREPLVYGFSIHMGSNGIPHIKQFGNLAPEDEIYLREPFTSSMVDEKKRELRITVQMPGINKKDIAVNAAEDEVVIKGGNKYYKKVKTPDIDPDSAKARYNNGILEITLRLKKPEGKTVKIE